ncbi:hypothetical protein [Candidatus Rhabdochlamydia porcellionis]|jgi:hypothetical protein|uniref:Uncharacterized protein n=1 Tax=Candidatus Rhabdochlamydia porcellionis TaxID=225148 RepID=A0ABX8Z3N5_9BACT|nr:hypothetical protein [Candidatus Rhabdochlamydia porcellionis]QZA58938.1 hypothetical protein RHAB15C_0000819 [Candidatus Rhabdochlamydia porcellionis]
MTISVRINGNFHQLTCPSEEGNQRDLKCQSQPFTLSYRCSECAEACLKCEAPRLNKNAPFVRGCSEARQLKSRVFSCACCEICEC